MASTHKITLRSGLRSFSAWSSHPESQLSPDNYDRLIILLHGFPDNNDSYNEVAPLLRQHFRSDNVLTVSPLLRGYEKSSFAPQDQYSMSDLADDVQAWILQLVPNKEVPVHIVGHDWGAIVAFKMASKYPTLVTSMVTLAIPYVTNLSPWQLIWYAPRQLYCLTYMITMQLPFLYRRKFGDLAARGYLDSLWHYWSPGWNFDEAIGSVRKTLGEPGVLDAVTAYYRNLLVSKNRKWPVDFSQVPTLILGGEKDGCMIPELFELEARLLAPVARAKVQLLSGVGHFMHREDPTKVGELICDWFEKYAE